MAGAWFLAFFVLSAHLLLHSAKELDNSSDSKCPESFPCGSLRQIRFPFTNVSQPSCGLCLVNCSSKPPTIQVEKGGKSFEVENLSRPDTVEIRDRDLQYNLPRRHCYAFVNISLPTTPSISYTIQSNITLFKCTNNNDSSITQKIHDLFKGYNNYTNCSDFSIYYKYPPPEKNVSIPDELQSHCWKILLPLSRAAQKGNHTDLFALLSSEFSLKLHVSEQCSQCHHDKKGHCRQDVFNYFHCDDGKEVIAAKKKSQTIILATSVIIGGFIFILIICLVICNRLRKKRNHFSYFPSNKASSYASSNLDPVYGVHVFSYGELVGATNNFQSSKELGDGGFGTVYHGKEVSTISFLFQDYHVSAMQLAIPCLQHHTRISKLGKLKDGREVAVKRLYEHNPKRVERFMNEIEILTRLRHKNLVTLYGCTSRHSRELLLVYEYIPNGTVGDHLHGEKANAGQLTWSIRMNIAVETASALAYLHASDIVHRDVKTDNILLDNNFSVKVADFGLSRLFPNDVTHVSTAPQGTPGYVDPEYHKCYQLTDKSDVYSFGVVLIELISSMTAVDISRHMDEINLANLAINKIQRCEYNELIDPKLGFETDAAVTRMTTSVAELAFRCLQQEKELRPAMNEVLEALMEIQQYEFEIEEAEDRIGISRSARQTFSPDSEDVVLLKNSKLPASPKSVADSWVSCSTTTSGSEGNSSLAIVK